MSIKWSILNLIQSNPSSTIGLKLNPKPISSILQIENFRSLNFLKRSHELASNIRQKNLKLARNRKKHFEFLK